MTDQQVLNPSPPSRRSRATVARIVGVLGSLALVSWLVVTGSAAVFSDTTDSTGNSFTAGDIALIDDDSGSMLFDVADMEPGQSVSECIEVTYQGSIPDPSGVTVYSGGYTDSGNFADYLTVTIEEGSPGSFGNCGSFSPDGPAITDAVALPTFDTTRIAYGSGDGVWDPTGTPESKTYRITVDLDAATPNAEQGESVTALTFIWEIQS